MLLHVLEMGLFLTQIAFPGTEQEKMLQIPGHGHIDHVKNFSLLIGS